MEKCHPMGRINYKILEKKLNLMALRIMQYLKLRLTKCCLVNRDLESVRCFNKQIGLICN